MNVVEKNYNGKVKLNDSKNRVLANRLLQNASLLAGITWLIYNVVTKYHYNNRFEFYEIYILPQSIALIVSIVVYYALNYALYKMYGSSKVNIDIKVTNKIAIVFDSTIRALTLFVIAYALSAYIFIFWSNFVIR
ncbi:hypothetical protein [Geobacter benzoatilyticus]|jgi:hypothetical protein|uniref:Uncharacterized protein n=1 Tax=Geobacter benzoatilyticus TaxID=2815309 RepID=A0ABX7Q5X2_9BACT|nr:hypothetical protein [Geobacter benzoatilyticus]QSV46276.1 hypothetical protein JZM60_03075 [Geobacter benzoatilyticus]